MSQRPLYECVNAHKKLCFRAIFGVSMPSNQSTNKMEANGSQINLTNHDL